MGDVLKLNRTKTGKNHDGFYSHSYFDILSGPYAGRTLKVSTWKGFTKGAIDTSAQVLDCKEERGFSSESFVMFQDPSFAIHRTFARCTEKAVNEAHAAAIQVLPEKLQKIL